MGWTADSREPVLSLESITPPPPEVRAPPATQKGRIPYEHLSKPTRQDRRTCAVHRSAAGCLRAQPCAHSGARLCGQLRDRPGPVEGNSDLGQRKPQRLAGARPDSDAVLIDPSSADVNNVSTITIEYDHTKTKGGSVYQGLDRPRGFAVAPGDESKIQCLNCAAPVRSEPTGSDTWSVTFQVRPLVAAPSAITFHARLRAGAPHLTGSSLPPGGSATPRGGLVLLPGVKPHAQNSSPH